MTTPSVRAIGGTTPYTVTLVDEAGHTWLGDEPAEMGGADSGPSPFHLLLSSLGACTVITLQMFASRKQWPLADVEVALQLNPAGTPASGTDITRTITLSGALSEEQRARLLQVANACPVHKLLTGEVRIDSALAASEGVLP